MTTLPQQSATYLGGITDTSRWKNFKHRPGDIFICTPPKCGTTWTQAICAMLVSGKANHGTQPLDEEVLEEMAAAASFDNMRNNAEQFAPNSGTGIWKKESGFFATGKNAQWKDLLTESDLSAFDARLGELLTPEQIQWLLNGGG